MSTTRVVLAVASLLGIAVALLSIGFEPEASKSEVVAAADAGQRSGAVRVHGSRPAAAPAAQRSNSGSDPKLQPEEESEATARRAVQAPDEPGATQLDRDWSDLGSDERRRVLSEQFLLATQAVEDGRATMADLRRAADALSGLRAEMYVTPEGRRDYEDLERRYDAMAAQIEEVSKQ